MRQKSESELEMVITQYHLENSMNAFSQYGENFIIIYSLRNYVVLAACFNLSFIKVQPVTVLFLTAIPFKYQEINIFLSHFCIFHYFLYHFLVLRNVFINSNFPVRISV